jgi:GMP synthase-like glutamine amidotransferase
LRPRAKHGVSKANNENLSLSTDCKGILILGGPMNVDEESKYPFLKEEKAFIRDVLRKEIPTCLKWGKKLLLNFLQIPNHG